MTTAINIVLIAVVAATTYSLIAQPASLRLNGNSQIIERWFRLQTLRTYASFVFGVIAILGILALNLSGRT